MGGADTWAGFAREGMSLAGLRRIRSWGNVACLAGTLNLLFRGFGANAKVGQDHGESGKTS